MRCNHCRKAVAADPGRPGEDVESHARECAACGAFLSELRSLDRDVARALAIEVPELRVPELPPVDSRATQAVVRLDTRRRNARPLAPRRKRAALLVGLAAGIALIGLVTLFEPGTDVSQPAIAGEVIAHMDHEQDSRRVTSVAVSDEALEAVLEPRVARLGTGIGLVSYASSCVIGGKTVPHLVVQGDRGPLTLILLPDETIDQPVPLSGVHVHGLLLPVGDGSIAIIGQREEQIGEAEETGRRLATSMKWRI